LYNAVQAVREDCGDKWQAAKRYGDEINKEVIVPLKELLQDHVKRQKGIESKWKSNHRIFEEKKMQVAEASNAYSKAFEEFDKTMGSYEKLMETKEGKELSEEKKTRLTQRIHQLLANCKETEKNYKMQVYSEKELKAEYFKALVNFSFRIYL